MTAIGTRIREIRIQRGLNQAQLARAIGRLPTDLHKWEKGRAVPSAELPKVAVALNASYEDLLGELPHRPMREFSDVEPRSARAAGLGALLREQFKALSAVEIAFLERVAEDLVAYRAQLLGEEHGAPVLPAGGGTP